MAFIWIIAAVIASLAQHRKILLRYGYRALFSQLNSDLDDMFLSRAARPLMPKQHFMIAWSYHRTLVRLTSASISGKQSGLPSCHGKEWNGGYCAPRWRAEVYLPRQNHRRDPRPPRPASLVLAASLARRAPGYTRAADTTSVSGRFLRVLMHFYLR